MGFGNLACPSSQCHSNGGMTHYPQINAIHRATRIQLATTQALIKLSDGNRAKARLQTVSVTGGMLHLPKALAEGDFVEVAFQTRSGSVHGMAEMLNPVWAKQGSVLQPFRFVALEDDDHRALHMTIESEGDRSFDGLRSADWKK
jgi:hypothetical protein